MSLQVTGKNIRVGESFQSYVSDKLDAAIDKYLGQYLAAHVRVEKERGRFVTSCSVRVRTGLMLESSGEGTDAYASADAAFEHLEKRLRRYKRRLKNRHHAEGGNGVEAPGVEVSDFVVELSDRIEAGVGKAKKQSDDNPLIIAENVRTLLSLPVSEAVMRLDLTEEPFLVFRNAVSGVVNVVYRRADGNIGWIDTGALAGTETATGKSSGPRSGQSAVGVGIAPRQSVGGRSKRSS
jgi:ribosomal subunit interface protein